MPGSLPPLPTYARSGLASDQCVPLELPLGGPSCMLASETELPYRRERSRLRRNASLLAAAEGSKSAFKPTAETGAEEAVEGAAAVAGSEAEPETGSCARLLLPPTDVRVARRWLTRREGEVTRIVPLIDWERAMEPRAEPPAVAGRALVG
mmetsp:Transcript_3485/g.10981  ORF Transcript_3485/g.10981 Transcript_3485/m.10981 type:complete len:151 (+) Transcript_3485:33-485(+)